MEGKRKWTSALKKALIPSCCRDYGKSKRSSRAATEVGRSTISEATAATKIQAAFRGFLVCVLVSLGSRVHRLHLFCCTLCQGEESNGNSEKTDQAKELNRWKRRRVSDRKHGAPVASHGGGSGTGTFEEDEDGRGTPGSAAAAANQTRKRAAESEGFHAPSFSSTLWLPLLHSCCSPAGFWCTDRRVE